MTNEQERRLGIFLDMGLTGEDALWAMREIDKMHRTRLTHEERKARWSTIKAVLSEELVYPNWWHN